MKTKHEGNDTGELPEGSYRFLIHGSRDQALIKTKFDHFLVKSTFTFVAAAPLKQITGFFGLYEQEKGGRCVLLKLKSSFSPASQLNFEESGRLEEAGLGDKNVVFCCLA